MSIAQTLQVQSQSLFAFQMPSTYLEDVTLKPLVDILPFSLSRVGSLAAGSAYGYSADNVKGALFYGLQAPGYYAGGGTLTVSLATPKPSPNAVAVADAGRARSDGGRAAGLAAAAATAAGAVPRVVNGVGAAVYAGADERLHRYAGAARCRGCARVPSTRL